jgi:hypothetical protein
MLPLLPLQLQLNGSKFLLLQYDYRKHNFVSSLVYINNTQYLEKEKSQKRIIQPTADYKIKY